VESNNWPSSDSVGVEGQFGWRCRSPSGGTHARHSREARSSHSKVAATPGGSLGLHSGVADRRTHPNSAARLFLARLHLTVPG
jgi:hypothetical protein